MLSTAALLSLAPAWAGPLLRHSWQTGPTANGYAFKKRRRRNLGAGPCYPWPLTPSAILVGVPVSNPRAPVRGLRSLPGCAMEMSCPVWALSLSAGNEAARKSNWRPACSPDQQKNQGLRRFGWQHRVTPRALSSGSVGSQLHRDAPRLPPICILATMLF